MMYSGASDYDDHYCERNNNDAEKNNDIDDNH